MTQLPIGTVCACRLCPTHAAAQFIPPIPSIPQTSDTAETQQDLIANLSKKSEDHAEPTKRFYKVLAEALEVVGVRPGIAMGERVVEILMEEIYGADTENKAEEVVLGLGCLKELTVALCEKVEGHAISGINTIVSEAPLINATTPTSAPLSEISSTSTLTPVTILTPTSDSPPISQDDQAREELAVHLNEEVAALRKDAKARDGESIAILLNALAEGLEAVGARAGPEDAGISVEPLAEAMGLGKLESTGTLSLLVYMKELLGALHKKVESMIREVAAREEN
ncbi:hypothetical protein EG329_007367 [Mollisiaceae sp. DMI_Dod_QoI]|nr:hypothetical protein EG329_007367 [Helotiales sp. DMI_Dod_QoI]